MRVCPPPQSLLGLQLPPPQTHKFRPQLELYLEEIGTGPITIHSRGQLLCGAGPYSEKTPSRARASEKPHPITLPLSKAVCELV